MHDNILTIVICTYNRAHILPAALMSLLQQTVSPENYSLLIIDNNSTDNTQEALVPFKDKFPHMRIVMEYDQGIAHARTRTLREVTTPWFASLDSDAKAHPEWVETILQTIEKGDFDGFGGPFYAWHPYGPAPSWLPEDFGTYESPQGYGLLQGDTFIPGGNCVLRSDAARSIGTFSAELGMSGNRCGYGEETQFFERMRTAGYRMGYVPQLKIDHCVLPHKYSLHWQFKSTFTIARDIIKVESTLGKKHSIVRTFCGLLISPIRGLLQCSKHNTLQQNAFLYINHIISYWGRLVGIVSCSIIKFSKIYDKNFFYALKVSFYKKLIKDILHHTLIKSYRYIPRFTTILTHYLLCREIINLRDPKNFNEKLEWLKVYYKNDNISICSDKYAVREYVDHKIQPSILNHLISVHDKVESINWNYLPDKFVIKCIDKNNICMQLRHWLSEKYGDKYFEFHYNQIKPRIIIERFLETTAKNGLPTDYKIYCFNGIPKIILVISGRGSEEKHIDYFDTSWKRLHIGLTSQESPIPPSPPKNLDTMLCYAQILSEEFPFVRADFYSYNDKIIFGELTFTPAANIDQEYSKFGKYFLGSLLDISSIKEDSKRA